MNLTYGLECLLEDASLPVLTAEAMRDADAATIADYGISAPTLMEVAGRGCARAAVGMIGVDARVIVVCGKGNNGGDGFVAARILALQGFDVDVYAVGGPDELSADAVGPYRQFERLAANARRSHIALHRLDDARLLNGLQPDLWIDALLGIGLSNTLREPYRTIADLMTHSPAPVLSVDIPTGLHADNGSVLGAAVRADVTVTMGAIKKGMLLEAGPHHCGRIQVAEIGIPPFALASRKTASTTTDEFVRAHIPTRPREAHKYNAGTVLVIGGSRGMTGAPVMTAVAAARGGAGYVMVACPEQEQPIIAGKLSEATTIALPTSDDGGIDAEGALLRLQDVLPKVAAVALGPGLGRHDSTVCFVHEFLRSTQLPVVIDADALFAVAVEPSEVPSIVGPRHLLTPHRGEFARLMPDGGPTQSSIEAARAAASHMNSTLLLKGMPSVVAGADGEVLIAGAGNNALATAGTGDVLAGLCASFLARGLDPIRAAAVALHVGGSAAEYYSRRYDPASMVAGDILRVLPRLMKLRFCE